MSRIVRRATIKFFARLFADGKSAKEVSQITGVDLDRVEQFEPKKPKPAAKPKDEDKKDE